MKNLKRALSLVLCLIMVVGLLPTMALAADSDTEISTVYTVTFDSDGGSAVTAQNVESGQTATEPTAPTKSGYTFKGWTLEGAAYDFSSAVTKDITLKAKWEAAAPIEYTIEVTLNGYSLGAKVADASVSESSDTVNIVTFADGKDFYIMTDDSGEPDWSSDVTEFAASTDYWLVVGIEKENGDYLNLTDIDEDDVTLAGGCVSKIFIEDDALLACFKLKPLDASAPTTYTVTFDSEGGSAVTAQTVESCKTATKPADPTKSDYTFKGWYLGETAYDFATPVTGNITLKAKWEKIETPTNPTDPTEPSNPTNPTDPTDPTEPSKPTTPTTPTNPEIPETGDNSNMFLWIAMLFASFFGVAAVLVLKKKNIFAR